jgi:pimeloyl-ACP methyl ester carboxylesterase
VHGLAASPSQFLPLKRVLEDRVGHIDAFAYNTRTSLEEVQRRLQHRITIARSRTERLVLIGHSLGGLLLSAVLQAEAPGPHVAAFVSICAPLHGTQRSRLAPFGEMRKLAPEGALITSLVRSRDRLDAWNRPILTVSADKDLFIVPHDSAQLAGHPHLLLEGCGHVGSLFDARLHRALNQLLDEVEARP